MGIKFKWHQFWYFNYNYLLEGTQKNWTRSILMKKSNYHGIKLMQLI